MAAKATVLHPTTEKPGLAEGRGGPGTAHPAGRGVSRDPLFETDRYRLVVPLARRPGSIAASVPADPAR